MSLDSINKDAAKIIGTFAGNFFPLSSISRKFRGFFQEERQKKLKKSKIMVKKNLRSSFLLTFDGKFFATGSNYCGQFGIGEKINKWGYMGAVEKKNSRESPGPTESVYKETLEEWTRIGPAGKKISRVVLSAMESVYVECEDGWYGSGSNQYFQLAPQNNAALLFEWTRIIAPHRKKIIEIIPTASSIYIHCDDGSWYARGWNGYGQLDPNYFKKYVTDWRKINPKGKKVLEVVVCQTRTFAHCDDGWYGCGKNDNGELGVGYSSKEEGWKKIGLSGKKIKQLNATELNTVIHCDNDEWYGCGHNKNGRLGTGNTVTSKGWVRLGPRDEKIKQVWLSDQRLFLRGKTEVYSCGWNESRIFGGPAVEETFRWRRLASPGKPIDEMIDHDDALFARCGEEWYGIGWDEDGYFGLGMEAHRYEWNRLSCKGKNIRSLLPAYVHAFTCSEEGWYFAGDVSWGQSGKKDKMEIRACWTKVLSHDETVEEMLERAKLQNQEINLETQKLSFRKALKKLYEKETVKLIEELGNNISAQASDVYIFYNKTDRNTVGFDIFIPIDYWEYGDEEYQFADRLREVLEHEYTWGVGLWRNRDIQQQGVDERYSSRIRIAEDNYEAVVNFLKEFESFLDQPENVPEENPVSDEGAEPERKIFKAGL